METDTTPTTLPTPTALTALPTPTTPDPDAFLPEASEASAATGGTGTARRPEAGAWEELVTAALLGTDRRVPAGLAGLSGPALAGALLDAAALHTVR
ncbi:hypothetical protein ACWCPG_38340, partial [Streptomyces sp. NPDC001919]